MPPNTNHTLQKEITLTTFETPEPISVTIDLGVGDVRIIASGRTDTVVEVRPSRISKASDVEAAERARVEFADSRLLVVTPKSWKHYTPFSRDGRIDVTIELPTGSQVHSDSGYGTFHAEGELGECRIKAANGDISVERSYSSVSAKTANGNVRLGDVVSGTIVLETACGDLEVGVGEGTAAWLDASSQYGSVQNSLEASDAPAQSDRAVKVRARTACGDIVIRRSLEHRNLQ